MKNRPVPGSLFGLLVRNYLLFTLTLLVIAGGIFCLWDQQLTRLYQPPDWAGLMADKDLLSGNYQNLAHYTGDTGSAFAVYDGEGLLVYASDGGFDPLCTAGELACVQPWDADAFTTTFTQSNRNSPSRYLVIRQSTTDGSVDTMVLNASYQVIFGGLEDGKTVYTPQEFLYLSGKRLPNAFLTRGSFVNENNAPMTILLREAMISDTDYLRQYQDSWKVWLLFIPLFLLSAGLFIWWLSHRIGRPLRKLNDAVVSQSEGRMVRVGDCGGTREIRRIGESFDRFSDRLAESEAERQRLDQGRQKLIADISHDLKTPITVIAGYIDAICDGKVPPQEQERYLRAIQGKAAALTELVDAFHEYSKVEHPEFVLHTEPTDLCEFLRAYLADKYDEIDLAGFGLDIDLPDRALRCQLDPLQFRRVLDNLLSNALRHNRLGTMLFFRLTEAEGKALLTVADNGAGIPPQRIKYIFEPFVVGSDARSGQGSGLGLSITRRIMELHNGSIALSARPAAGQGTEFLLTLPLWQPPSSISF
ncbi:MAG: HAMP domain-containing histidine kinase [Clostridiales bacterium]|nr:HAMP domain-containing histidine kinase [Clostridiales bacterium]